MLLLKKYHTSFTRNMKLYLQIVQELLRIYFEQPFSVKSYYKVYDKSDVLVEIHMPQMTVQSQSGESRSGSNEVKR